MIFELIGIVVLAFVFAVLSNTTIDQTPKKRVYSPPTPYCPSCATKFSWKDMLPFVSFLRTRGKCPYCHAPLPTRHILNDILELSWVALYVLKFGWSYEGSIALLFGMALIGIIFLTKEKREVSDSLLMIMGLLAVIHFLAYNPDQFPEAALGMILGTVALAFYNLTKVFATDDSQFELTEIKIGALLGLFLGIGQGLVAIFFALLGGVLIGIVNMVYFKKNKREAIPPFTEILAGAGLLAILLGQDFLHVYHSIIW